VTQAKPARQDDHPETLMVEHHGKLITWAQWMKIQHDRIFGRRVVKKMMWE
jgi:hypothetical protein